jgi:hypothetical protein
MLHPMIIEEIKELKTGSTELRNFGLVVGGVFTAIGVILWLGHSAYFGWGLWVGLLLIVSGVALPRALKYLYIGWMSLAIVLGLIVSTLLLTVFFFFVLTPIGLAARIVGKDFLRRKLDAKTPSYWIRRPGGVKTKVEYEQQF